MKSITRIAALVALLALPFYVSIPAQAEDAPSPAAGAETADKYSAEELEEIVGPIALYPDIVVSSLLPASTVPMDVVQAARWVHTQEGEIAEAPEDKDWDDSVKAMVQFPDVLVWMGENLDWMEELGYAVDVQQADVLAAIQAFRANAQEAGNLESSDKQVVTEEEEAIYIEPAQPEVVYIPQYVPTAVVTQPNYQYPFWAGVAAGAVGAWAIHSIRWGSHGGRGSVNINRSAQFNFNNNGNINRGGGGAAWRAPAARGGARPATRPRGRAKASTPKYNRPGNRARPAKGGVKAAKPRAPRSKGARPGATRPGSSGARKTAPRTAAPKAPAKGGARSGAKPRKSPPKRSAPKKSAPKKSNAFSGSSRSGSSTRKSSSRGKSSLGRSGGSSRSSGRARSSGGGGRRGGGGGRRR